MDLQPVHPHFIEIETGSYCNRICSWCPNGWSDRGRARNYMEDKLWQKIILDLAVENYAGWLAFHNYNEPLADPTIFDKIVFVNQNLLDAKTALYTNGDYLSVSFMERLIGLAVKEVRVTLYPDRNEIFKQRENNPIADVAARLNLKIEEALIVKSKRGREIKLIAEKTTFHFIVPTIKNYTTRGDTVNMPELIQTFSRQSPCFMPTHSAAIDYLGNLKLCCQIYNVQEKGHAEYCIGNLDKDSFWQLWNCEKMKTYRRNAAKANFEAMRVCQGCSHTMSEAQMQNLNFFK